jgi:hypothetical protein
MVQGLGFMVYGLIRFSAHFTDSFSHLRTVVSQK